MRKEEGLGVGMKRLAALLCLAQGLFWTAAAAQDNKRRLSIDVNSINADGVNTGYRCPAFSPIKFSHGGPNTNSLNEKKLGTPPPTHQDDGLNTTCNEGGDAFDPSGLALWWVKERCRTQPSTPQKKWLNTTCSEGGNASLLSRVERTNEPSNQEYCSRYSSGISESSAGSITDSASSTPPIGSVPPTPPIPIEEVKQSAEAGIKEILIGDAAWRLSSSYEIYRVVSLHNMEDPYYKTKTNLLSMLEERGKESLEDLKSLNCDCRDVFRRCAVFSMRPRDCSGNDYRAREKDQSVLNLFLAMNEQSSYSCVLTDGTYDNGPPECGLLVRDVCPSEDDFLDRVIQWGVTLRQEAIIFKPWENLDAFFMIYLPKYRDEGCYELLLGLEVRWEFRNEQGEIVDQQGEIGDSDYSAFNMKDGKFRFQICFCPRQESGGIYTSKGELFQYFYGGNWWAQHLLKRFDKSVPADMRLKFDELLERIAEGGAQNTVVNSAATQGNDEITGQNILSNFVVTTPNGGPPLDRSIFLSGPGRDL